jgi:putative alpha-1,2-mannosidase
MSKKKKRRKKRAAYIEALEEDLRAHNYAVGYVEGRYEAGAYEDTPDDQFSKDFKFARMRYYEEQGDY